MSEKSLEQKQLEYDAWMKSMEAPEHPPQMLTRKNASSGPAHQNAKKASFKSSGYVTFLQSLAVICLLGGALTLADNRAVETKVVIVICAFFTGIVWLVAAHALKLLEEIHWKGKQD